MMKLKSKQHGLTLIELMIALVISLIILAGLYTVYQTNKRGSNLNDGVVRMQENGRFAIDFLTRDMRMAYFPANFGAIQGLAMGVEGGAAVPDTLNVIQRGTAADPVQDCQGNNVAGQMTNTYTIADTGRNNNRGQDIFALFCNNVEMVEGIENMQVLYGVDTDAVSDRDGVANEYVTANNVPNWSWVVSVRVALLANSVDELAQTSSARVYPMLGANIGPFDGTGALPADNKIRREYTTTTLIRNHVY